MLPKYKYLLTYRYAEIIHDGTEEFTTVFLLGFDHRRTREQMNQAARSGKQNIVEGVGQSNTSKKGEIKLLGVAKASFDELLMDFEDFLRQRNLTIWPKDSKKVLSFKELGYKLSNLGNLSDLGNLKEKLILPNGAEDAANLLLTFCHMETYLLDRQIKALENKFISEGGYSENLFKKRLSNR